MICDLRFCDRHYDQLICMPGSDEMFAAALSPWARPIFRRWQRALAILKNRNEWDKAMR